MQELRALLVVSLGLACAHKGVPPNPDRFRPSLVDISVPNRNRVDLVFDEAMSSRDLKLDDYVIRSPSGESLGLVGIAISPDNTVISLLTCAQRPVRYTVAGVASDAAGNSRNFSRSFLGSAKTDTVAPMISSTLPRLYAARQRRNVAITFTFTKPLDTLTLGEFLVLPHSLRDRVAHQWTRTLVGLQFSLGDSLGPDTVVTFILPPNLCDFAGNHLASAGFAVFMSDSVDSMALPRLIRGRLLADTRPVRNSYVVFAQAEPVLATIGREDGSFAIRARRQLYGVTALADTNLDGWVDLRGHVRFGPLPDSLVIALAPETSRVRLDSAFYATGEGPGR